MLVAEENCVSLRLRGWNNRIQMCEVERISIDCDLYPTYTSSKLETLMARLIHITNLLGRRRPQNDFNQSCILSMDLLMG